MKEPKPVHHSYDLMLQNSGATTTELMLQQLEPV